MKFRIFLITLGCITLGIVLMFSWSAYSYYEMIHSDDPIVPSLTVIEGRAKIIRGAIAIDLDTRDSYTLETGDAIETEQDSIASISWPDHSVTRLGPQSRIVIHEMIAEAGYEKVQISFSLKKGKIWSTVVRALIGDSYFETRLPKNDIIAGVRGTIYEINLDSGYIRAISHAIHLRDGSDTGVLLIPGELIDSENIWIKKGKEFIDMSWDHFNTLADTTYIRERTAALNTTLSSDANILKRRYDMFVRWILGHFDGFRLLTLQDLIKTNDIEKLLEYSPKTLAAYYERIQFASASGSIDTLRHVVAEKAAKSGSGIQNLLESMQLGVLWDTLDSGNILPGAQKLLESGNIQVEQSLESLKTLFLEKDLSVEMQNKIKELIGKP